MRKKEARYLVSLFQNPRNQNTSSNQARVIQGSHVDQMNTIITLRFGKQIDNQIFNPNDIPEIPLITSKTTNDSNLNIESDIKPNSKSRVSSFTSTLTSYKKHSDQMVKILKIFKQVKMNIPL